MDFKKKLEESNQIDNLTLFKVKELRLDTNKTDHRPIAMHINVEILPNPFALFVTLKNTTRKYVYDRAGNQK